MKILNPIRKLLQGLLLGAIVLSISASCCLRHQYLEFAKSSDHSSAHDCCDKNSKSDQEQPTCLDCSEELTIISSSILELAKQKITNPDFPQLHFISNVNQNIKDFSLKFHSKNLSNAPNPSFDQQFFLSLSISSNAPPVII